MPLDNFWSTSCFWLSDVIFLAFEFVLNIYVINIWEKAETKPSSSIIEKYMLINKYGLVSESVCEAWGQIKPKKDAFLVSKEN